MIELMIELMIDFYSSFIVLIWPTDRKEFMCE